MPGTTDSSDTFRSFIYTLYAFHFPILFSVSAQKVKKLSVLSASSEPPCVFKGSASDRKLTESDSPDRIVMRQMEHNVP